MTTGDAESLFDEQVNKHTHNTLRAFTVVVALPSAALLLIPPCSFLTQKHQNNIPPAQLLRMASKSISSAVRYKFVFFSPPQYLSELKTAIFATGAGTFPNYSECCFITHGKGQFRPSDSASPAIGTRGQLEEVEEVRCELICNGREITERAVAALKKYEFVAFAASLIESLLTQPSQNPSL